ncbi:hypothetical protein SO802_015641 [Lithocarpus litseifolius]|uniref:Uncharacterized protein n=1 Tax=Lithocarpus litseifolius TaxID=425828 RepID=A0AAW2CU89_9ROSI
MPQFSKPTFSLLLIIIVVISISTVRSEYGSSTIRLPSEYAATDLYANSNNEPVPRLASCPIKCFRANPICGVDGVTYWCGYADALYACVKDAKLGFYEVSGLLVSLCSVLCDFRTILIVELIDLWYVVLAV